MDIIRQLLLISLFAVAASCAEPPDDALDADESSALSTAALKNVGGTRTTIASIVAAENQLITSDGRLFVTGDKGIFELQKNADGSFTTLTRQGETNCQFGGITEARGVLYANCYNFTDSFLYAAKLSAAPTFRSIATLTGRILANGLTSDAEGRLYIATTLQNQILRITTAANDPLTVSVRETWLNNSGVLTNGIKYSGGAIYWTDGGAIKRAAVQSDGRAGAVKQLGLELTVLDDLNVDREGILVADFLGGVLRAYDPAGKATAVSTVKFDGPSSVSRALGRAGFSSTAVVVTERNANRVSLYEPK